LRTIKQTNPERDLNNWSKENGTGMGMNWPVFEVKFNLFRVQDTQNFHTPRDFYYFIPIL